MESKTYASNAEMIESAQSLSFDPDEIESEIASASDDPREQMFFVRLDCKRVIRSEEEYKRLLGKTQMTVVSYNVAMQIEHEAALRVKRTKLAKKTRKAARAARRLNR